MDLSQLYFYQYLPPLLSLSVVEPLAPASFNLSEDDEGDAVCDEFVDEELLCLLDDPFNNLPNNNFLSDFFCVICYKELCLDMNGEFANKRTREK